MHSLLSTNRSACITYSANPLALTHAVDLSSLSCPQFHNEMPDSAQFESERAKPKAMHVFSSNGYNMTGCGDIMTNTKMEILGWFVANGADLKCKNDVKETILHTVANKAPLCIMEWIFAQENGTLGDALLTKKTDSGETPLHTACSQEFNEPIIRYLLDKNPKLVHARCDSKKTPLFNAVDSMRLAVIKLLMEYGASFDVKNEEKMYPLHYCECC